MLNYLRLTYDTKHVYFFFIFIPIKYDVLTEVLKTSYKNNRTLSKFVGIRGDITLDIPNSRIVEMYSIKENDQGYTKLTLELNYL